MDGACSHAQQPGRLLLKTLRRAFTLIEILVSVLILSVSIVYVLKIHSQNREQIIYITERNTRALQDSLFLGEETLRYHKETKNAYDLLRRDLQVRKDDSRQILKKIERKIYIPEEVDIRPQEGKVGPRATVHKVLIKDTFSSSYTHFKLHSL